MDRQIKPAGIDGAKRRQVMPAAAGHAGAVVHIYCTGQRSPHKIFFNRLPGPPRRLDLTQMVLMTTESASSESGGRQAGAGGSAKTRACIRGIPRSARGRGRVAQPDATPDGGRARGSPAKL